MSVIYPGLLLAIERFPDHRDAFKRLYAENGCFQSLCESYRQCFEARCYWAESGQEIAPERYCEYNEILHELEMELLQSHPNDQPTASYS